MNDIKCKSLTDQASLMETPDVHTPTLIGRLVTLQPLEMAHASALLRAASDGSLWNLKVTVVPGPDSIDDYIAVALAGRREGHVMPFAIVSNITGLIVGCTRFWKINPVHRKMEIGQTWLSVSAQGTGINTEAKFLLLQQAFEAMDAVRVQLTTDELNHRSQAAILGIGAKQEGIVRHERIMPDGRKRNSIRFSIIDSEWPEVKSALLTKLSRIDKR